jgi:hypothetical protein
MTEALRRVWKRRQTTARYVSWPRALQVGKRRIIRVRPLLTFNLIRSRVSFALGIGHRPRALLASVRSHRFLDRQLETMSLRYTLLVNQIVGAPTTPAFCIALLSSSLLTKACAASSVAKSWVTVMSSGLSTAWYTA